MEPTVNQNHLRSYTRNDVPQWITTYVSLHRCLAESEYIVLHGTWTHAIAFMLESEPSLFLKFKDDATYESLCGCQVQCPVAFWSQWIHT